MFYCHITVITKTNFTESTTNVLLGPKFMSNLAKLTKTKVMRKPLILEIYTITLVFFNFDY